MARRNFDFRVACLFAPSEEETNWYFEIRSFAALFIFFARIPNSTINVVFEELFGRFGFQEHPRSAPGAPSFPYRFSKLAPRGPQESPQKRATFQEHPKSSPGGPSKGSKSTPRGPNTAPRDPHETGTSKSGSITLATALLREYFQECYPICS